MYKVYFKQAIELLKQNKFISIISIAATALAIMMVMVIVVVDHIKHADIAPESNRSDLMYIKQISILKRYQENWINNMALSPELVKDMKRELKSAKYISATTAWISYSEKANIQAGASKIGLSVDCRPTDTDYWKIFNFKFIEGKALSQADIESGINSVVIAESLAHQLFGKENALGKELTINKKLFKVAGVVQDISKAFENAYSQIWVPYTTLNYEKSQGQMLIIMVDDDKRDVLDQEFRKLENKMDLANDEWIHRLRGPYDQRDIKFPTHNEEMFIKDKKRALNRTIFLFAVMMIIPTINLSGLSLSRVRRRMEEIGIRKAFGAKKLTILVQILYENFITALLGGLIGLILSFFMVYLLKGWLLDSVDEASLPIESFISLPLLLAVVLASFVLNLLSSGVPAYRAANMNIVDSLNLKNN